MSAAAPNTSELYCVVPPTLSEVLPGLRDTLGARGVAVIVERRDARTARAFGTRHQRALHLPRQIDGLPEGARVLQRMPAATARLADAPLMAVLALAADGDATAATELVFRVHGRVFSRLQAHHRAEREVEAALGRMLDRVGTFDGYDAGDFYVWLDDVVDDR
jgi:hypothetical protein